jgi:putative membrane protein
VPDTLLGRWNGDPVLLLILLGCAVLQMRATSRPLLCGTGWAVTSLVFLSPLCALSVSLFSARVAQHMILLLVAAPLIAAALPRGRATLWWPAGAFSLALWVWHMPVPYDATFHSNLAYWAMHLSLFGSAIWLWRDLLHHGSEDSFRALAAGTAASLAMSLLGAVIALSNNIMYSWHQLLTEPWGMRPIADQQLGGTLMWVPGCLLFLWAAVRSISLLWERLERPAAAE